MSHYLDRFAAAYATGASYAFDNEIMLTWYPRRIVSLCGAGGSLLELGVGHGYSTGSFSRHFRRHLVLEGSAAVIEQFHRQFPNCPADIRHTTFEEFDTEEGFDVIVMGFILEHVADPQAILRRFARFLAPGGRFFLTVPNAQSLHRRLGHEAGLLPDLTALGPADLEQGHLRFYSVETLRAELREAGYQVVREEGVFLKPLTTSQLLSLELSEPIVEAMCKVGIDYPELCNALLFEAQLQDGEAGPTAGFGAP